MVAGPAESISVRIDSQHLSYLEPTPEDMAGRRPSYEDAVGSDIPEKAEKEEEVPVIDLLVPKMALGTAALPKCWSPSWRSWSHRWDEVGVDMHRFIGVRVGARHAREKVPKVVTVPGQVPVPDHRRFLARDRQRQHGAVGENGAGAASGSGVESLTAENDAHGSVIKPGEMLHAQSVLPKSVGGCVHSYVRAIAVSTDRWITLGDPIYIGSTTSGPTEG